MAYYAHLTATSQVKVGLAKLKGIFASSGTSVTVAIYDTPDADTNDPIVIAQFTAATPGNYMFSPEGLSLNNGLYVVLGGTNPKVTIAYE
jgi:hypothetical protein